jgi:hypothetical protein
MHIAREDVDVKMEIPGAVIRQQLDFGDATGLGRISPQQEHTHVINHRKEMVST